MVIQFRIYQYYHNPVVRIMVNLHSLSLQMTDSFLKAVWKIIRINWLHDERTHRAVAKKFMGKQTQLVQFTDQKHIFPSYIYSVMFQGYAISKWSPYSQNRDMKERGLEYLIYFILPNLLFSGLRVTASYTLKQLV